MSESLNDDENLEEIQEPPVPEKKKRRLRRNNRSEDEIEIEEVEDDQDEVDESESSSEIVAPLHSVQEIVWAKVRGHAWWPATMIATGGKPSNDIKYLVIFVGDQSRS
jgi:hypothetical protein